MQRLAIDSYIFSFVQKPSVVVSDSIVEKYSARRIAREDRYETNRKVISEFYSGSSNKSIF